MEIENTSPATVSNFEVMSVLQNIRGAGTKKNKGQLATITYETLRYLENTPSKTQSADSIRTCLQKLSPFKLNKNEKLMLINNPPQTALEIQLMIDEGEERLTQEQVDQILQIMTEYFPQPEPPAEPMVE